MFLFSTVAYAKPIFAYQEKYAMSFSVWKPNGVGEQWFATFDGYPVREFLQNQWIYGVFGGAGEINDSQILVGDIDPRTVYLLRPLPMFADSILPSFWKILGMNCDHFAIIRTEASLAPIGWKQNSSDVFVWNGKGWTRIFNLKNDLNFVAQILRKNRVMWTTLDSLEFANFVRTAGYIWIDDLGSNPEFTMGYVAKQSEGNDGTTTGGGSPGGGRDDDGWDTGR